MYLFDPDSTEFSFSNSVFEEKVKVGIEATMLYKTLSSIFETSV